MKLTKLSMLAGVSALALCAFSVKAAVAVGSTTNYSSFNFSGTITTNSPEVVKGSAWKDPIVTSKFGNKQLLDLFAGWTGADRTTDPWKSARLEVAWTGILSGTNYNYGGDIVVADRTGTNVLFDASRGVSGAYFYVEFGTYANEYGVGADGGVEADPGFYGGVATGTAYFELYDDNVVLPYTDIWGYGGNKQVFNQTWDASGNYKTWTDSEIAAFLYNGGQYFKNFGSDATSTATITAHGSGKGENYIGWF